MEGNYVFIALILLVKQGKHKICLQRSRITLLSTEKRQRHLKEPGHRQQQYFLERLLTDYDWLWISDWCEDYHVPCPIICVCSKSGHSLCFPHLLENDSLEERRIWAFQEPSSCYPCDTGNIWHLRCWEHHIAASSMFQFHQRKFWDISESPRSSFWCVCFDVSTILSVWESGSGINSVHFHIVLKIIMTKLNLYIILKTEKSLIICFVYSNPLKYSVLLNHHMLCLPANSLAISLVSLKSVKH